MSSERRDFLTTSDTYRAVRVTFRDIVTRHPTMLKVVNRAREVAPSDLNILLSGENGTGKNLFAQAIHNASNRIEAPFVALSCSTLSESLMESELFGHEKGAFTGADRTKRGRFELAHKGTLFLDEISELSFQAQAKLLRAVEYKEFERVGGEETLARDVRVIAATNRDIESLVAKGLFRKDLYYRLAEMVLELLPLRQRVEDVAVLTDAFVEECNRKYGKNVRTADKKIRQLLCEYDWPGNVRELRSAIKRGVAMSTDGKLATEEMGIGTRRQILSTSWADEDLTLATAERNHIERVLVVTGGNKKEACRLLGISRPTLDRKLKSWRKNDRRRGMP